MSSIRQSFSPAPNKGQNDILYLRRKPTVTFDSTSGDPIPEAIKKLYVQQHLPVRKQSLAAFNSETPTNVYTHHSNIPIPIINTIAPSDLSNVEGMFSTTITTNNEEEEEFNFNDRPPSSIICIKPIDEEQEEQEESDDSFIPDVEATIEDEEEFILSDDYANQRLYPPSPNLNWRKGSIGDIPSLSTSRQYQLQQHSRSKSVATIATTYKMLEETQTPPSPSLSIFSQESTIGTTPMIESYSSLFLTKMQAKKEEQQKSIDAYRSQNIYTALLSQVAKEFQKRTSLSSLIKDGIEYHNVFTGKEAVDRLVSILRTQDRLEALEVGCALRNQNFFRNVNYEPILVDSFEELYVFKEDEMRTPNNLEEMPSFSIAESLDSPISNSSNSLPNGIYTDLTDCYSPTCTNDNLCYSWSCIRKKSLKQSQNQSKQEEITRLWSQSVPENIVEATLPQEIKRQECIYELIYTEQDFVRDLLYVHDFWVDPLLSQDIIQENSEAFVKQVFFNIADIRHVNTELARALENRQGEKYLVSSIGDVMLEHVRNFQPFVEYGAHQVIGKFYFELEKKKTPAFAQFVEETERKPESRRLELNGYLTKPTTRLGRYNLLLREILKQTPNDNPDKELIPQIMNIITHYLEQVNIETGKCENLFNLKQIGERLEFKGPADYVDLKLEKPGRQLLMKGRMKRKGNSSSEASDLQVFLFDHYLVFAKIKYEDHLEVYKTYRRPIPLELLTISVTTVSNKQKRASSILPYSKSAILSNSAVVPRSSTSESLTAGKANNLSITFTHHGRKGSPAITLFTSASSIQKIWIKKINDQKALLVENRAVFTISPLLKKHFSSVNRVNNTATLIDDNNLDGKRLIIAADQGVYVTKRDPATKKNVITRIINLEKVSQIELLSGSQLLVLADKTLWSFPLDVLSPNASPQAKRGRSVSQNTAFFHVGECLSKTLICVVKPTLSATTIRVLEPVVIDESKKSKSVFSLKRLVRSGPTGLKLYKDLYYPASGAYGINLLTTKMCISSPREIGIVDMNNLGVQALLDPEDEELGFIYLRADLRPITIYRIQADMYLVCYNELAFFVDKRGRFIRNSVKIVWEGAPDSFALSYPYILAFEPEFIEIRHVHTGELEQIIRGKNIRCTSTHTHNTLLQCAMDDSENDGYQLIFELDAVMKKNEPLTIHPPPYH